MTDTKRIKTMTTHQNLRILAKEMSDLADAVECKIVAPFLARLVATNALEKYRLLDFDTVQAAKEKERVAVQN
jgi:hypothetical protein